VKQLLAKPETVGFKWPSTVADAQIRMGIIADQDRPDVPEVGRRIPDDRYAALLARGHWSDPVDVTILP